MLDRVAGDERPGQARRPGVDGAPLNDGDVYEPGDSVTVMHIDGATAVVFKERVTL